MKSQPFDTMERLLELAGVDGARDIQMQDPLNDRSTPPSDSKSWDDGQDEFNPDVQDINDDHRGQSIQAMTATLQSLEGLNSFLATVDATTDPQYNTLRDQIEAMSLTLNTLLGSKSYPGVDAPYGPSGMNIDPSNGGGITP
jgi:hypothetical protein